MTLTLRPATPFDAPAFHAVMLAAGMDARSSWTRTTLKDLERSLLAPDAGGFIAVDGGEVIGCIGFRPNGGQTLTLNRLATLPKARGQGIGTALVRAVEQVASERGYEQVLLAVSQFNLEVIPYYERLGYVVDEAADYAFRSLGSPKPVVMVKKVTQRISSNLDQRCDEIVGKLAELRKLDPNCLIFGLETHRYELHPPLSEEELEQIVRHLGIDFPEDYARFLRTVCNGGAGPDYGLFPLEKSLRLAGPLSTSHPFPHRFAWQPLFGGYDYGELSKKGELSNYMDTALPDSQSEAYDAWHDSYWDSKHNSGCIQVGDGGCGHETLLVLIGNERGNMWQDSRVSDAGIVPLKDSGGKARITFLQWYEDWLDRSIREAQGKL
ncbi:GNAT family N-acetyltransferase [Deinococcus sp.]|uniref:GNAT family N-acetyltransferase n=1 Tax=Deinococcus sp. TaxID=47478 RepID=UPI003B5B09C6